MYSKKLFLILLLVSLFFNFSLYGAYVSLPGTGIRVVGTSAGSLNGPTMYIRWQVYPFNFSAAGVSPSINPAVRTSHDLTFSVPWVNVGHCDYWAMIYDNCCNSEDEDSFPEGTELIEENHYIQNPFDYPIWIRTFYDGNTIDTTEIPVGGSQDFELLTLAGAGDPDHFDFRVSSNGSNYSPVSPVDWYNLIQELSKMFGRDVWGDGITTNTPVDFLSALSVTNDTTDLIYDFQKALQNQNLSGEDIQKALENALINNTMTKEGITYAMIDGIVFSGLPEGLRNINATEQGVITAIDGIEFDMSDVVSAINNIDCSVDTVGIITAIEEQELSITNNIYLSSTNNIMVTNDFNFAMTNNIIVTNDFNFNITNNIILTNIVDLFTGDPLEGGVTNTMNFSEDYSADSELTTEFNSDITDYLNVKSNVFNSIFTGIGIDVNDLNPFECDVEFPVNTLIDISVNLFDYDLHFTFDLDMIPFIDLIRKLELLALTILVFFKAIRMLGWAFE
ncbi:MAG: hypothetical protein P9L97_09370 [Candidatus Tenebribacter davisii]|nr:hypothetical protein [Candidatus Tenebribacter davisii]